MYFNSICIKKSFVKNKSNKSIYFFVDCSYQRLKKNLSDVVGESFYLNWKWLYIITQFEKNTNKIGETEKEFELK